MKIQFRQGIVSIQSGFLSFNGTHVDLNASTKSTVMTLAHKSTDYIHSEDQSVPNAWPGPFEPTAEYWLYFDFNLLTFERTFGHTTLEPIIQSLEPSSSPTNGRDILETIEGTNGNGKFVVDGKWVLSAGRQFAVVGSTWDNDGTYTIKEDTVDHYDPATGRTTIPVEEDVSITNRNGRAVLEIDSNGVAYATNGRMWYNPHTNTHYEYQNGFWNEVLRVFAAKFGPSRIFTSMSDNATQSMFSGTQIGDNTPVYAGRPVFTELPNPIIRDDGSMVTTEDQFFTNQSRVDAIRLESNVYRAQSSESSMAQFSVVAWADDGRIRPAIYTDVSNTVVGMLTEDLLLHQVGAVIIQGSVSNPDWNWTLESDVGDLLWIKNGELTHQDPHLTDPNAYPNRNDPVARILSSDTIVFQQGIGGSTTTVTETGLEEVPPATTSAVGGVVLSNRPGGGWPTSVESDTDQPVVVETNDPRMTDARTPRYHTHPASQVTFQFSHTDYTSNNVQGALEEVEDKYVPAAGGDGAAFTGPVQITAPGNYPNLNKDIVPKDYVDALYGGFTWLDGICIVNLIADNVTDPDTIASPNATDVYIVPLGSAATWQTKTGDPTIADRDMVEYTGSGWLKIAVLGDYNSGQWRIGIAMKSDATPAGSFAGKKNHIVTLDATAGIDADYDPSTATIPPSPAVAVCGTANSYPFNTFAWNDVFWVPVLGFGTSTGLWIDGNRSIDFDPPPSTTEWNALAIGADSEGKGQDSISIGTNSESNDLATISIGKDTITSTQGSIVIGYNSRSTGGDSVGVGTDLQVSGAGSVSLGSANNVSKADAVVIGNSITLSAIEDEVVIIGSQLVSPGAGAIVLKEGGLLTSEGSDAQIVLPTQDLGSPGEGAEPLTLGTAGGLVYSTDGKMWLYNNVTASWEWVNSSKNWVNAHNGQEFSFTPVATGTRSIGIGEQAQSLSDDGIVIGTQAYTHVDAPGAVVIGKQAQALEDGSRAVVIGDNAIGAYESTVAVGDNAIAGAPGDIAIGRMTRATGGDGSPIPQYDSSIVIGEGSIGNESEIIIGADSESSGTGNIMIGKLIRNDVNSTVIIGNELYIDATSSPYTYENEFVKIGNGEGGIDMCFMMTGDIVNEDGGHFILRAPHAMIGLPRYNPDDYYEAIGASAPGGHYDSDGLPNPATAEFVRTGGLIYDLQHVYETEVGSPVSTEARVKVFDSNNWLTVGAERLNELRDVDLYPAAGIEAPLYPEIGRVLMFKGSEWLPHHLPIAGNNYTEFTTKPDASGTNAIAAGDESEATGEDSIAIGTTTVTSKDQSVVIGENLTLPVSGTGLSSCEDHVVLIGRGSTGSESYLALGEDGQLSVHGAEASFVLPSHTSISSPVTRPLDACTGSVIWDTDEESVMVWDGLEWKTVNDGTFEVDQPTHGFTNIGTPIRFDGTASPPAWVNADATDIANAHVAVITSVPSVDKFVAQQVGEVTNIALILNGNVDLVPGDTYYLNPNGAPSSITNTVPVSGDVLAPVLVATGVDAGLLLHYKPSIQVEVVPPITKTVGSGGDFETFDDAMDWLGKTNGTSTMEATNNLGEPHPAIIFEFLDGDHDTAKAWKLSNTAAIQFTCQNNGAATLRYTDSTPDTNSFILLTDSELSVSNGLTLELYNGSPLVKNGYGITCENGNLILEDCTLKGFWGGVAVYGNGYIRIGDTTFEDHNIGVVAFSGVVFFHALGTATFNDIATTAVYNESAGHIRIVNRPNFSNVTEQFDPPLNSYGLNGGVTKMASIPLPVVQETTTKTVGPTGDFLSFDEAWVWLNNLNGHYAGSDEWTDKPDVIVLEFEDGTHTLPAGKEYVYYNGIPVTLTSESNGGATLSISPSTNSPWMTVYGSYMKFDNGIIIEGVASPATSGAIVARNGSRLVLDDVTINDIPGIAVVGFDGAYVTLYDAIVDNVGTGYNMQTNSVMLIANGNNAAIQNADNGLVAETGGIIMIGDLPTFTNVSTEKNLEYNVVDKGGAFINYPVNSAVTNAYDNTISGLTAVTEKTAIDEIAAAVDNLEDNKAILVSSLIGSPDIRVERTIGPTGNFADIDEAMEWYQTLSVNISGDLVAWKVEFQFEDGAHTWDGMKQIWGGPAVSFTKEAGATPVITVTNVNPGSPAVACLSSYVRFEDLTFTTATGCNFAEVSGGNLGVFYNCDSTGFNRFLLCNNAYCFIFGGSHTVTQYAVESISAGYVGVQDTSTHDILLDGDNTSPLLIYAHDSGEVRISQYFAARTVTLNGADAGVLASLGGRITFHEDDTDQLRITDITGAAIEARSDGVIILEQEPDFSSVGSEYHANSPKGVFGDEGQRVIEIGGTLTFDSARVSYDNSLSQLTSTNVKDAIDEISIDNARIVSDQGSPGHKIVKTIGSTGDFADIDLALDWYTQYCSNNTLINDDLDIEAIELILQEEVHTLDTPRLLWDVPAVKFSAAGQSPRPIIDVTFSDNVIFQIGGTYLEVENIDITGSGSGLSLSEVNIGAFARFKNVNTTGLDGLGYCNAGWCSISGGTHTMTGNASTVLWCAANGTLFLDSYETPLDINANGSTYGLRVYRKGHAMFSAFGGMDSRIINTTTAFIVSESSSLELNESGGGSVIIQNATTGVHAQSGANVIIADPPTFLSVTSDYHADSPLNKLGTEGQFVIDTTTGTLTIDSDRIDYDNGVSGLTATNVKDAIDEVAVDNTVYAKFLGDTQIVKTVGTGGDFTTIADAMDWYGTYSSAWVGTAENLGIQFQLKSETHTVTETMKFWHGPGVHFVAETAGSPLPVIEFTGNIGIGVSVMQTYVYFNTIEFLHDETFDIKLFQCLDGLLVENYCISNGFTRILENINGYCGLSGGSHTMKSTGTIGVLSAQGANTLLQGWGSTGVTIDGNGGSAVLVQVEENSYVVLASYDTGGATLTRGGTGVLCKDRSHVLVYDDGDGFVNFNLLDTGIHSQTGGTVILQGVAPTFTNVTDDYHADSPLNKLTATGGYVVDSISGSLLIDSDRIVYDNSGSQLVATEVESAIDELDEIKATLIGDAQIQKTLGGTGADFATVDEVMTWYASIASTSVLDSTQGFGVEITVEDGSYDWTKSYSVWNAPGIVFLGDNIGGATFNMTANNAMINNVGTYVKFEGVDFTSSGSNNKIVSSAGFGIAGITACNSTGFEKIVEMINAYALVVGGTHTVTGTAISAAYNALVGLQDYPTSPSIPLVINGNAGSPISPRLISATDNATVIVACYVDDTSLANADAAIYATNGSIVKIHETGAGGESVITFNKITNAAIHADNEATILVTNGQPSFVDCGTNYHADSPLNKVGTHGQRVIDTLTGTLTIDADRSDYDNATSGLVSTDVQSAIDELVTRIEVLEGSP